MSARRRAEAEQPTRAWGIPYAGLSFVLEVGMIAAAGYLGFRVAPAPWNLVAGIGLPLVLALLWGFFLAPKAGLRLPPPWTAATSLLLFLLAAGGLALVGQVVVGGVMAILALLNTALGYLSRPRG